NDEKSVQDVQEKIKGLGSNAIIVQADVTTIDGSQRVVNEALKSFGTVDILVNNAGPLFRPMSIEDMTWEDMSKNLNEDMGAAFNMKKTVLDNMKQKHRVTLTYINLVS